MTAMVLIGGCSLALDASEVQCEADIDCADRGFEGAICQENACIVNPNPVDPRWACLGNIPEPVEMPGEVHTFRQQFLNVVTEMPPAGLAAKLCRNVDVNCGSPTIDSITADNEGFVEIEIASGFEGFLELTTDETIPALIILGPPVTQDLISPEPLNLVSLDLFSDIATTTGFIPDDTRGHALAQMNDCSNVGAPGVSITISVDDPDIQRFYLYNLQPAPEGEVSDESGNGGFFNIPTGFAGITATLEQTGQTIAVTQFQVRAQWLSYVPLFPTFLE